MNRDPRDREALMLALGWVLVVLVVLVCGIVQANAEDVGCSSAWRAYP